MGKASRRKANTPRQGVLDRARDVIQSAAGAREIRVRSDLPQEEKISHALSALLESEVSLGSALEEYRAALDFIVMAWNISLMEADNRSEALEEVAAAINCSNESIRREALGHIERLMSRKQALFPDDRRHVVSWEVRFQGAQVRVSAAALAPSP